MSESTAEQVTEPDSIESGVIDAVGESVADWVNAIPFTAEHDRLLRECHAGLMQLSQFIESVPEMLGNSPIGAMLGMSQE